MAMACHGLFLENQTSKVKTYGEYDFSQLRKAYSSYASQGDVGMRTVWKSMDQSSVLSEYHLEHKKTNDESEKIII